MHALVLELTGKKEPADGLQAKFSGMGKAVIGPERCSALIEACWTLSQADSLLPLKALA